MVGSSPGHSDAKPWTGTGPTDRVLLTFKFHISGQSSNKLFDLEEFKQYPLGFSF